MRYPVDPHTHTVASSHAYSTVGEYVAEARRRGVRLFACTDHGPAMSGGAHPYHFANLKVIPHLIDGVGVLRGIEANILDAAGRVDVPEVVSGRLDVVIGSLHDGPFTPGTPADHTRALVAAMEHREVDIIGHPGNPLFPVDVEEVARAAAAHGVALEINNSSFGVSRKGSRPSCLRVAEAARDLGALVVMGSDSHVHLSLGGFSESLALLEEVGFPPERILNASAARFLEFLERRGHPRIPELDELR